MPFRWRDSASIAWAANSAPAKMYVHVSGGADVSCASGVFTFANTGGVLDRAANGSDYDLGVSYVQVKVTAFGTNSILRLRLRSDGTNYVEATINLTTGAFTLGNQAGSTASGTVDAPPAVNDSFRLEASGTTTAALTLKHDPASTGTFTTVTDGTGTASAAATGRAGFGITAVAGTLDNLDLGPTTAYTPKSMGSPTTRAIVLRSFMDTGEGDAQGQYQDAVWTSLGSADWEAQLAAEVDSLYTTGWRRMLLWAPLGLNSTGIIGGVDSGASNAVANLIGCRHSDILLATARSGFGTGQADGRALDNFLTAWSTRVAQWDEVIAYIGPPPQGISGQTAWPTTDAALEEYVQEFRQLGMSIGFDSIGGINPNTANSSVAAAFFDYLLRSRRTGERFYIEPISPVETGYLNWTVPPYTGTGSKVVGPVQGRISSYDTSGTSFWERATRTELGTWHGPWKHAGMEHIAYLDGSVAAADRFRLACEVLLQGYTVIIEPSGLSASQVQEIIRLGRVSRSGRRRGARRGVRR